MALFGGGKPDHPMADAKQARKLIAELPINDPIKTLDEISFWVDSVSRTEGFRMEYRYELLDWLDQAAKAHQRKLSQEYLGTDRQEKFRENKLWSTVFEFWKTLASAYTQCIEQFQAGANGAATIKKDLPTIIARAMRALTLQLKWIMLRYGIVDDRLWAELGKLYLFAEAKGITTAQAAVYPGLHGQGAVQQEFLKAMMLSISSTDGLTPVKQEIAERTVAHFGGLYKLQPTPVTGCNYYYDLSMRKPPARLHKRVESTPTTRYFGAGEALAGLRQLVDEIQTKRAVPSNVNLGGTYPAELVLSVMQHLATYWSDNPPARRAERRKVATRMTVVHGFQNVLRNLEPPQDDISLDFHARDGTESWIVENMSEGGFGAIIPQVNGDWIKVGNLLGVQTETAKYWGAGVVRRITRDEFQQRRVGIQVLSNAVIPVTLAPAGEVTAINAIREGEPGLLLSTAPDRNGEVSLLLRAGSFTLGQKLEMKVRGKQYYLMPSKMSEGGEDFDWAKFKVQGA